MLVLLLRQWDVRFNGGCSSAVESWIVIPVVVGSNPISHPKSPSYLYLIAATGRSSTMALDKRRD